MTEIDQLEHDIANLKRLLAYAWRHLAETALSTHERREMRNEMNQHSAALRACLDALGQAMRRRQSEADERVATSRRPATPLRLLQAA